MTAYQSVSSASCKLNIKSSSLRRWRLPRRTPRPHGSLCLVQDLLVYRWRAHSAITDFLWKCLRNETKSRVQVAFFSFTLKGSPHYGEHSLMSWRLPPCSLLRENMEDKILNVCETIIDGVEITSLRSASHEHPCGKPLHRVDLVERLVLCSCNIIFGRFLKFLITQDMGERENYVRCGGADLLPCWRARLRACCRWEQRRQSEWRLLRPKENHRYFGLF